MFNGLLFHFGLKTVGLPRFELGQTEPKPVVLPLHHSTIIMCFPWKAVQRYVFPAIYSKYFRTFFCNKVQMLNFAYKLKEINT